MVHQRWGTAGAFIALSTLCWQPVAFPAIAGVAVAALLGTGPGARGRLVALARIAVGGIVPTRVTVLAYVAIGKLQVFLDAFFWINLRYTQQTDLADNPSGVWHSMSDAYRSSLWTLLLGTIVILALGVHVARRAERRTARGAALVGLAVHVLVCVLWSFKAFNGWPDAFFVLPASMLGIGALVALLERRAPGRAAVAVVVVWALVATALSVAAARYNRNDDLLAQRADVDAVMAILPRDATLASVEAPQPLVLAHRRNLSRFQLFGNGLADYVDDTWPGGTTGYGRWLVARRPTVIAVGEQSGMPDWLPPAMAGRYVDVGASDGWELVGPQGSRGAACSTTSDRRWAAEDARMRPMTSATGAPPLDRRRFRYSVVIPVYNSEAIVGTTVDRVVEVFTEAGLDHEVILVNDGSPDGSWDVIAEKARTLPSVVALDMLQELRPAPREPGRAARVDRRLRHHHGRRPAEPARPGPAAHRRGA